MGELPVSILAIVIPIVPITTFVGGLLLGMDRVEPRRMLGLVCGAVAILLLILPEDQRGRTAAVT